MEMWSDIARNGGEKTADRLRATELLGKAQGDFIERTENKNLNVHAQLDRPTSQPPQVIHWQQLAGAYHRFTDHELHGYSEPWRPDFHVV
jgi:hypothetical protein